EVTDIIDFSRQKIEDADGKIIPSQKFLFVTLVNGVKFAVRASETEPKIKFYLFAETEVTDRSRLETAKSHTSSLLGTIGEFLRNDAAIRANFIA
ncbi:MAG: phospho-sugar mutase, partial [Puniceicoccales bacterium]|nr:phospho-sugar mutase [Puniceicoccales bacterium]